MWYRSDLTAMKYSDGTNAHELAALDLAQTFKAAQTFSALGIIIEGAGTGVGTLTYADSSASGTLTFPAVTDTLAVLGTAQIFTAAQTFNGGIIFNAAGSIAATSTYIEVSEAGGSLKINTPSSQSLELLYNGVVYFLSDGAGPGAQGEFYPNVDATGYLGLSSNRLNTVISNLFSVYHAKSASFPTAQLADGVLNFGTGLVATDTAISRAAAGVVGLPGFKTAAGGTAPTTVSLTSGTAYTPSTTQNTIITIGGGTVTAIAINGTTTGLTSGTFYLKANDTITVTFTSAPTALQMVA
jgi:hypothetical protein